METMCPTDLPKTLGLPPGNPQSVSRQFLWFIILFQFAICIFSSVGLSYFFYKALYPGGKKSWKKARETMAPVEKRLRNLEKEKVIWNLYLEWMEDYCAVYYGLLNYLHNTVTDLGKFYKDHSATLKNLSDTSDYTIQSELGSTKSPESHYGGLTSEPSWEGLTSDEDVQLVTNFARVFTNLKAQDEDNSGSGDVKRKLEFPSTLSLNLGSTNGTNEESARDELESLIQTSDEEAKFSEDERRRQPVQARRLYYNEGEADFDAGRELPPVSKKVEETRGSNNNSTSNVESDQKNMRRRRCSNAAAFPLL